MSRRIPLSVPCMDGREIEYISKCIQDNWVSTAGEYVNIFESQAAEYTGSKYAVAVNSGTSALHLALLALGVSEGDEVLVPALTFIAPVNAVRYVGASPVFMDCDEFLNMDPEKVVRFMEEECSFDGNVLVNNKTGRRVAATIVVHLFGCPANLSPVLEVSNKYNVRIVEDAAESIGAYYDDDICKGKKTGAIGDFGCYSFNGNKIITTGAGGMVLTSSRDLYTYCKYLSTQAKDDEEYYVHDEIGYNYRMSNIQAAMGVAQLESLERFIERKESNLSIYKNELSDLPGVSILGEPKWGTSNNWFYTLMLTDYKLSRDELIGELAKENIQTRPLWKPNHLQKPYRSFQAYDVSRVEYYYDRVINLPCSVDLSSGDIHRVCEAIKSNAK